MARQGKARQDKARDAKKGKTRREMRRQCRVLIICECLEVFKYMKKDITSAFVACKHDKTEYILQSRFDF